ncbi:MAG: DUF4294 domain-containing protein [Bacteroidetes bacterium]|nr:DUF4294 domain-containing protein [Bacteroidota bacterium]MBL6962870.1 DUF4294 domain-containing protein [Bacteroidota bacterium]
MQKVFFISFLIFLNISARAQKYQVLPAVIENGDTVAYIQLAEFKVSARMSPRMRRWYNRNDKLIRNIRIVMPYAKIASARLMDIDRSLVGIEDEKLRKKYYKIQEQKLIDEFEIDIRKMTFSQGKLLIKLIDRETGKTSYSIIHEYRSGLTAAFWQGLARIFGYNLKVNYNAAKEPEIETAIKLLGYE